MNELTFSAAALAANAHNEPTPADPIGAAKKALEDLGCVVILWVEADMPGATEELRNAQLNEIGSTLEDICIQRGNELIEDTFPTEDDEG